MASYQISMNVGDHPDDITIATGGAGASNYVAVIHDDIDRSDASKCLRMLADKLDESLTAEPPAALS